MGTNARVEWQWRQLRLMKMGGNEAIKKYFQSHGGSAALASKDSKTKYGSSVAESYKKYLNTLADKDIAK